MISLTFWRVMKRWALENSVNAVRELLPHSNVDARGGPSHATALYLATYGGHLETTKLLLEVSDRTIRSSSGLTPEMVARSRGFTCVQFLLDQHYLVDEDADASRLLDDGRNALFLAAQAGRATTVGLLASVGAAVDATSLETRAEFVDAVGDLSPWVTPKSAKGRRRRFGQPAADRPSLKLGRARSRPTTPRGASPLRAARTAPSSMPLRRSPTRGGVRCVFVPSSCHGLQIQSQ